MGGLGSLVGLVTGSASALFLFLLEEATRFRTNHELIVYGLPLAGLLLGWPYERFGRSKERPSRWAPASPTPSPTA